jgi:hypothetical protein
VQHQETQPVGVADRVPDRRDQLSCVLHAPEHTGRCCGQSDAPCRVTLRPARTHGFLWLLSQHSAGRSERDTVDQFRGGSPDG